MSNKTAFLLEQTKSGKNKCKRTPLPELDASNLPLSLPERRATAFALVCQNMPLFIDEEELIVGTRTLFEPLGGNKDGHDVFGYTIKTPIPYLTKDELEKFGEPQSYINKGHCTPDFSILLDLGIDGIIQKAQNRKKQGCTKAQQEFLSSVEIAYQGLKSLILRYSDYAFSLSKTAPIQDKERLEKIGRVCKAISGDAPKDFYSAVQLFWFGHLACIMESFAYVCYGRADVILGKYINGTDNQTAQQLIDCLLLKMYDQADLVGSFFKNYTSQLIITLGGVLENGENAVNDVTMMFLDATDRIRLPEPELNLRLSSKNPHEFLEKASRMTVSGCNHVSYYNDDIFVKNLISSGIKAEDARNYGFDLCQDITIPGKADFYAVCAPSLAHLLMDMLKNKRDYDTFEQLTEHFKQYISACSNYGVDHHNLAQKNLALYRDGEHEAYFEAIKRGEPADCLGKSPAAPLPFLSGLFHGCIESAVDFTLEGYPIKERGMFFGTCVEAINSLAAIKKTVFDQKIYTLDQIYDACANDFNTKDGEIMRNVLWNCPKWGNDDKYVDVIAADILNYCLKTAKSFRTFSGGNILAGIHQPHPVVTGKSLMATPEGRHAFAPVAVTLTPESGSCKNGATAILSSALNIDASIVDWNFCVMINYYASVFKHNDGDGIFRQLLTSFFENGGMQHQPNITDVEQLKKAKLHPEQYQDLIVRMWGVSARFVDLPGHLQDEMIARFE